MTMTQSISPDRVATNQPVFDRYHANPIIQSGGAAWRKAVTFNPGVIRGADRRYYLLERAAGVLRPFQCSVGLWVSDDGLLFELAEDKPVLTPSDLGYPEGAIEDPRVVFIDGTYYMTFAFRPYAFNCMPTAVGLPEYTPLREGLDPIFNNTRSGIATSTDLRTWTFDRFVTEPDIDDRDVVLFPEKIGGRFLMLRRPQAPVGSRYHSERPSIWLTESKTMETWSQGCVIAEPRYAWEGTKIGAAAPPLRTDDGWLLLHHGVDETNVYRVGALLLDAADPTKLLARSVDPVFEPQAYYERIGAVIPNVVFPTALIRGERDQLLMYYGCCDTCIAVATTTVKRLMVNLSSV